MTTEAITTTPAPSVRGAPETLRVLHVVRRMNIGGLEAEVIDVARGLEGLGFVQAVCCLEDRGELADRLPASVPVQACAEEGERPQRLPRRAAGFFRAWRPDVIHARNGSAWIDAGLAWLLAGRPGRLAFSIHGWTQVDRMSPKRAFVFRRLARITPALAAVSDETAGRFAEESGIPLGRFVVLSSGVDTARFHPADAPPPAGRLVLGCVGRLDPIKAHDVLIEAIALASAGGLDVELQLLGDGPLRAELERLARERGVADRVRFLGMVSDVPERLRGLDALVLASRREGRPISIMEAMATGLPSIATRVGSIPTLLEDGVTGLLVEPGDPAALARAIGSLADAGLRRRLGEQARRVALAELSLDRMFEQYAAFYRELVRRA